MRNSALALAALVGAATSANAQVAAFAYTGEVIEIRDDLDIFGAVSIGSEGTGAFVLDLDAAVIDSPVGDLSGLFSALSMNAQLGDVDVSGDSSIESPIIVALQDNVSFDGGATEVDAFEIDLSIGTTEAYDFGSVSIQLVGTNDWFETTGSLPDPLSLGFENLLQAEVVIEFFQLRGAGGGDGSPGDGGGGGGGEMFVSRAVINIGVLSNSDGTVATIGCRAYQFGAPVALFDFNDVVSFLAEFSAQNAAADLNGDTSYDFNDVLVFLNEATTGCSN